MNRISSYKRMSFKRASYRRGYRPYFRRPYSRKGGNVISRKLNALKKCVSKEGTSERCSKIHEGIAAKLSKYTESIAKVVEIGLERFNKRISPPVQLGFFRGLQTPVGVSGMGEVDISFGVRDLKRSRSSVADTAVGLFS